MREIRGGWIHALITSRVSSICMFSTLKKNFPTLQNVSKTIIQTLDGRPGRKNEFPEIFVHAFRAHCRVVATSPEKDIIDVIIVANYTFKVFHCSGMLIVLNDKEYKISILIRNWVAGV